MKNINVLLKAVIELVPEYLANPLDYCKTEGNWAICIIDEENNVYGRMNGSDKNRIRQSFKVAWTKASQVWITGYKTREYEKLVYTGKIDSSIYGISDPDFIGWEGGQPVTLKDGTKLSIGFSGFRGISDLEIVIRAIKSAGI